MAPASVRDDEPWLTKTLTQLFVGALGKRPSLPNGAEITIVFVAVESAKETLHTPPPAFFKFYAEAEKKNQPQLPAPKPTWCRAATSSPHRLQRTPGGSSKETDEEDLKNYLC